MLKRVKLWIKKGGFCVSNYSVISDILDFSRLHDIRSFSEMVDFARLNNWKWFRNLCDYAEFYSDFYGC